MGKLEGLRVFLSASFPSGRRGERYAPYDPSSIADAVTAITRAILDEGGVLVFGAHPTISPLVMLVAGELGRPEAVHIYQSRHFEGLVPEETLLLVQHGLGVLHWISSSGGVDLEGDLERLRTAMMLDGELSAGVFVGGMEGVQDEYDLLGRLRPAVPRIPVREPGGAARRLALDAGPLEAYVEPWIDSMLYPVVARRLVDSLGAR